MAAKGYTTKAKVGNYLLQDIGASFDDQIDKWIEAMEGYVDYFTGRNFIADENASTRLYDGDYTDTLLIDDCIEVTKVEQGQDTYGGTFTEIGTTGSDKYVLLPANYSEKGVPIFGVKLISRLWTAGTQNNRITAKWGYSEEVPADIEFVTTVFVAGIINQHRQGGSEIKSEKIGNYSVTYNSDDGSNSFADLERAKETLYRYKRTFL